MPSAQFFERGPSKGALQSQLLGQGLGQVGGQLAGREYQKGQIQEALNKLKASPGKNPLETAINFMEAGAGIPGFEKYAGRLFPLLMQYSQAGATGEGGLPTDVEGAERPYVQKVMDQFNLPEKKQMPGFLGKTAEAEALKPGTQGVFPTNEPQLERQPNAPEQTTTGELRHILSEPEIEQQAMKLYNQRKRAGIPTTLTEAKSEIREKNKEDLNYNTLIKNEREERKATQEKAGLEAETMLTNLMPDASDEEKAIFAKLGENLRLSPDGKGLRSEADFKRALAKEAEKFKNTISNVQKSLEHPRWWKLGQKLSGKDKSATQAAEDMRGLLKPLLDLGLYDRSRTLLKERGFYPEEVEKVINPLDTRSESYLKTIPKASEAYTIFSKEGKEIPVTRMYSDQDKLNLTNSLKEIISNNQNASLLLLRKNMEDKGYDWRIFKDVLNDLVANGLKLSDDQQNQTSNLNSPPLDNLDKLLHGIGIIGR